MAGRSPNMCTAAVAARMSERRTQAIGNRRRAPHCATHKATPSTAADACPRDNPAKPPTFTTEFEECHENSNTSCCLRICQDNSRKLWANSTGLKESRVCAALCRL